MSLEVNEIILIISEIIAITTLSQQLPITLLVLDSVINGLVILLVGYLIGIHVVLKCKGMTTYEYIKSSRKKKENKVKHMETDTAKIKDSKLVNDEIKKSIIKSNNQSVLIKPYSFSIAKSLSEEEIAHLTFHVRTDQDKSLDNK
jgi:membrane protein required for beta-lactamase induction